MGFLSPIAGDLLLPSQGITYNDLSSCREKAHIQQGTEATWQQFRNVWGKHPCRMRSEADCPAVTMDPLEQMEDGSEVNVL